MTQAGMSCRAVCDGTGAPSTNQRASRLTLRGLLDSGEQVLQRAEASRRALAQAQVVAELLDGIAGVVQVLAETESFVRLHRTELRAGHTCGTKHVELFAANPVLSSNGRTVA